MHRLLGDDHHGSEVDLELPLSVRHGVWGSPSESARSLVKIALSLLLLIGACLASFWAGTWISKGHSTLDDQCAARTSQWRE